MRINFVKVIDVLFDEDEIIDNAIVYLEECIDDYIADELCSVFDKNDIDVDEHEEVFENLKKQLIEKIIVKKC